ncbi:MAG: DUF2833 domain-containing protein [Acidaminococcaceae bacterium]|nr:DUF2833 domain-containing protein [Acidaminococcaceae bacterium]
MVKFVEPTEEQLLYIADHLKKDDYREIVGLSGRTGIRDNLLLCARCSQWARVALFEGVPMAAFGVYATNPYYKTGCIWMLTTEVTQRHKIYVGKKSREGIKAILKDWDVLWNYVDAGNVQTIQWLEWMGAKVSEPEPLPPYGCLYRYFEFRKEFLKCVR